MVGDYELFGLRPGATLKEVKRAYRRLATRIHPEAGGSEALFRSVSDAYERLEAELTGRGAKRQHATSGWTDHGGRRKGAETVDPSPGGPPGSHSAGGPAPGPQPRWGSSPRTDDARGADFLSSFREAADLRRQRDREEQSPSGTQRGLRQAPRRVGSLLFRGGAWPATSGQVLGGLLLAGLLAFFGHLELPDGPAQQALEAGPLVLFAARVIATPTRLDP